MARQRFDTAPEFNVANESVLIKQEVGSSSPLLEMKNSAGATMMSIDSSGQMSASALSTFTDVTATGTVSLPSSTSIGSVSSIELSYLDGTSSSIQTQLNTKASLASPTFTGSPSAPTASAGTNTTQIATTAFVRTEISNIIDSAPSTLDTLNELALALGNDANFSTTVTNSLSAKAPLVSPSFSGTPTAPTAAASTNTTQIATTEFVMSAIPAGTVQDYVGSTEPSGWKFLNGQTLANAQTLYPQLWAAVPATWRSGSSIVLPDASGRVSVAKSASGTFNGAIGSTGGVETVALTANQSGLRQHQHGNYLTNSTVAANGHRHDFRIGLLDAYYNAMGPNAAMGVGGSAAGAYRYSTGGWNGGYLDSSGVWSGTLGYSGSTSGSASRYASDGDTNTNSATATVGIANVDVSASNAAEAHTNLQPYIVLNKIIKVH